MSRTRIILTIPDHQLQPAKYELYPTREERGEYRWTGTRGAVYGGADAWKLRKDFLECPPDEWMKFLETTGYVADRTSQKDFEEWQRLLRTAMVTAPKEWDSLRRKFDPEKVNQLFGHIAIQFDWDSDMPVARLAKSPALGMIITSIKLDALEEAKFRLCARHDCNAAPFKIGNHEKQFCSYECAHLAAVRRSRDRAAEKKGKKAAKNRGKHGTQKTR
jgi:hypothetical protein